MIDVKCLNFFASVHLLAVFFIFASTFSSNGKENGSSFRIDKLASSWAIRIPSQEGNDDACLAKIAKTIAKETGLAYHGQIGGLRGHFLLVHESFYNGFETDAAALDKITQQLYKHPEIKWSMRERIVKRYKRSLRFKDQYFPNQWHLVSSKVAHFFIY